MTTNKAGALTQDMVSGEPSSVPATFEPVAWGIPRDDGLLLDVICPSEHARAEGSYTAPLYTQAAIDAAVAAERERCAKVCEGRRDRDLRHRHTAHAAAADDCARAIRQEQTP